MTEEDIRRSKCIVDASVAVKWFSEEKDTAKAQLLLDQTFRGIVKITIPDLLIYEVSNALWKSKKAPMFEIAKAITTIYTAPIEIMTLNRQLAISAARYMTIYDLTYYDAVYAALAEDKKLPLLTADIKDFKKIKEIEVLAL